MDNDTQQFIYRSVIISVCAITGSIVIFLFISAIALGDGEAIRIIGAMLPLLQSLIGAMVATVLGSHAATAYATRQMAQVHMAQIAASGTAGGTAGAAAPGVAAA